MECEFPTINADHETIKAIFQTVKTIAVLGLSPDPSKPSHYVSKYLQEVGYSIVPIYPKGEAILDEKVYRSLEEIPFAIDMVIAFRKPSMFDAIVKSCIKRKDVRVFWAQVGLVNNQAAQKAQNAGIIAVQNLCAMVEHRRLFG